ncbi:transmembrane and coiled-coil domain protein 3-like isoform X1 [Electrophorus electricus]|uniref:transmembrane and coiled-coil domain protein 3-like isoform X1 n=1 Tax=Electrophorus electricus TaxID=8005 RepID=UPI0015D0B06B|nr:transmembrane and coiled-coil domain protein 3-like isoform X1 [Electrophorus electricus]
MEPRGDGYVLSIPVPILRGGSDSNLNTSSDLLLETQRSQLGLDSLQQKILKVTEQLRVEQMEQDDNVAEFLKLVNMADKQQVARIRQVFEKKNQKSAHSISQLQKKLEQYHRRMKDSESTLSSKHSSPKDLAKDLSKDLAKDLSKDLSKDILKDMSGSGRHPWDKIKTIGPGVSLSPPFFFSKSREFANLIRNKFGSADNIAHFKNTLEESGGRALGGSATIVGKSKYHSDDECSTGTSASSDSNGNPAVSHHGDGTISMVLDELREIRRSQVRLAQDMETLNEELKGDSFLTQTLEEERYRIERLEEQLNVLVELHQREMVDLKQELASIAEKVAYQANERARDLQVSRTQPGTCRYPAHSQGPAGIPHTARDLQEALESCQTRLSKMEDLQQQQAGHVEGAGPSGRVLLGKVISVLLAVATLLLVCVSTAARFITPAVRSRQHLLATALMALLLSLIWRNWGHLQNLG